ncbi:MAG: hypothetical protein ACKVPX_06315 [Myxococcaceae bacterium]
MKRLLMTALCCTSFAAFATSPPPPAATKAAPPAMGAQAAQAPMFTPRKVTKEDIKGIEAMLAAQESAMMKGDIEGAAAHVDFPAWMMTDDAQGVVSTDMWDKRKFMDEMAKSAAAMPPDMKMSHKRKFNFLTNTMALVNDDISTMMGKKKMSWRSANIVIHKDGKWMLKGMLEGGWGDAPGMKAEAMKTPAMNTATGTR